MFHCVFDGDGINVFDGLICQNFHVSKFEARVVHGNFILDDSPYVLYRVEVAVIWRKAENNVTESLWMASSLSLSLHHCLNQ